jgi:endonuclease YncB( thermonuclease family)
MYKYKATVVKVIDGDTVKLKIDLGFRMFWVINCRLSGIDAPELSEEDGKRSLNFLSSKMPIGSEVEIESKRLDKYGRPIVVLTYSGINMNQTLIEQGYATKFD